MDAIDALKQTAKEKMSTVLSKDIQQLQVGLL
mgnify:CR=1 FL=1